MHDHRRWLQRRPWREACWCLPAKRCSNAGFLWRGKTNKQNKTTNALTLTLTSTPNLYSTNPSPNSDIIMNIIIIINIILLIIISGEGACLGFSLWWCIWPAGQIYIQTYVQTYPRHMSKHMSRHMPDIYLMSRHTFFPRHKKYMNYMSGHKRYELYVWT